MQIVLQFISLKEASGTKFLFSQRLWETEKVIIDGFIQVLQEQ